jgi:hypothetical protein
MSGHELIIPARESMGQGLRPADTDALLDFLEANAALADAIVVSIEGVVHGGIEFSHHAALPFPVARKRLERLFNILHPHGGRASLYSSATRETIAATSEEMLPLRDRLARWNRLRGRALPEAELKVRNELAREIPAQILREYDEARARNLKIQKSVVDFVKNGAASRAWFLQDDATPDGPHVADQREIESISAGLNVQFMSGGDDAASMLVAAAALDEDPQVFRISVILSDAPGMARVAPCESTPFRESFHLHMRPLGLIVEHGDADAELYLHPPVPGARDLFYDDPPEATLDLSQFSDLLKKSVAARKNVLLIDCGHAHGADPHLMKILPRETLSGLSVYSAWSTASNSLGSGLAHAAVAAMAQKTGRFDSNESARLVWLRLLDDYVFQTVVRQELRDHCLRSGIDRFQFGRHATELDALLDARMQERAAALLPFGVPPFRARFPWNRLFECEIEWTA